MTRLLLPVSFMVFLLGAPVCSQHLPGVAMGNYAGTQALYHNPAFVADSRYSVHANLVGAQMYLANNHIKYDVPYSFLSLLTNTVPNRYRNEKGAIILPRTDLEQKLNGRPKHLNLGLEARGPSLMVSLLDGKVGFGLSSRLRTVLNLTQTTEPIARALRGRGKGEDIQRQLFENQSSTLHINGLGEVALTLGGVLMDNETDFFKVGITAKRLIGLYNAHILVDDGSFSILPDANYANEKELIRLPSISTRYGYTTDRAFKDIRPTPAWLLGNAPAGSGWGFDLGMVYEYRPSIQRYTYTERGVRRRDGSKNKYLYRLSVALTDVGSVRFKNPNYVSAFQADTSNRTLRYARFQKLKGTEGFFNAVNQSLGVDPNARTTSFRSVLPMALQTSLDYQIQPNVYVNALWVQNLVSAKAFGMKGESVLAITPRYEHRWYEVSVPLSVMNRYGSLGIGLAGRVGPVWFGTDHLTGLLNIGKPKTFNLYAGVSAGLFRRPPRSPNACFLPDGETFWQRLFRKRY
ncbi:DUF5723 family protein [Salmonirosea aquatica]|uniref:DUF5723 domain-containing protein n=1 Tax=Salmonirosea aquatica TaxID=2654236 RepID=A0A7C9FMY7_9BACT|nr:hypothetical protein [Cytophagaceae bacterium SJW1-29]